MIIERLWHRYHKEFATEKMYIRWGKGTKGIIAVKRSVEEAANQHTAFQNVLGVVILENWTATAVNIHIHLESVECLLPLLKETLGYVFDTCKRKMILGYVPSDNERSIEFNKKLGMELIATLKDAYDDGVDYLIFKGTKHSMRFK